MIVSFTPCPLPPLLPSPTRVFDTTATASEEYAQKHSPIKSIDLGRGKGCCVIRPVFFVSCQLCCFDLFL